MPRTKVTPWVSWEESKGESLAEAGEVRDVNWEGGRKKARGMVTPLMIKLKRWKHKLKMCWELIEVALWLNIDCSSLWEVSISLLNLIISYGLGKCSQFVLSRCGNYYSFIYWTCFRSTHQKTVTSLLFKFHFKNIFSELKQIVEMNHKDLAEPRRFSSRFAWLVISPDRQSVSWWNPGITHHDIQNKLCCYMLTMLLLSSLTIRKKKSKASLFISSL